MSNRVKTKIDQIVRTSHLFAKITGTGLQHKIQQEGAGNHLVVHVDPDGAMADDDRSYGGHGDRRLFTEGDDLSCSDLELLRP